MQQYQSDPNPGGIYQAGSAPLPPAWAGANAGAGAPAGAMPVAKGPTAKWPALRLIATILKIVAWIEAGLGVLSALGTGIAMGAIMGGVAILIVLFSLVVVAIGFLLTYAYSEFIMLFISIEENTRAR